jgi:hypothetical protein
VAVVIVLLLLAALAFGVGLLVEGLAWLVLIALSLALIGFVTGVFARSRGPARR